MLWPAILFQTMNYIHQKKRAFKLPGTEIHPNCNKRRGAYASTRRRRLRKTMSGIHLRHLLAALVAFAFAMAIVSLALVYFFPAPPSTITFATGPKGTSFDYFGQQYRERLARDHINLELRETNGAVENLKLLQDPDSGVDAAFVAGGVSNSKHAPGLLSLGTLFNNAIWTFYHSSQSIEHLSQLKGKRIAVGPTGSATRQIAEKILGPEPWSCPADVTPGRVGY